MADIAVVTPPLNPVRSAGYWQNVGRRLIRDKTAMGAACVLLLILLAAMMPKAEPRKKASTTGVTPIRSESRPPQIRRESMSRPNSSVPSR